MVAVWIAVAAILLVTGILAAVMIVNAFRKRIIAEEIFLSTLPAGFDGFRILFITDIHRRRLPRALLAPWQERWMPYFWAVISQRRAMLRPGWQRI